MLQELETLENSHNAMLQQTIISAEPMSATDQPNYLAPLSATPKETKSGRDQDVTTISHELNEMHIVQSEGAVSELGIMNDMIGASRTTQEDSGTVAQRLAELSHRCRSLFAQLDIQNLLQ